MNQFETLMLSGCIVIFILIILINVLIYKWIVNRAIKSYIKIYLESKGYELYGKQFPGFFFSWSLQK